ncbi:hypothetical protein SKAU_G00023180 [Synaphobranchus kaupii]|uniref:Uncharacterized protein n=1 Tax=Synaphobranchus kaupii TaxID=118154 RepID=A0A9Q1JE33_SYNKA|nr:hypothetical protein SKAU_G00023180 [Synaphobranchus kaupii]
MQHWRVQPMKIGFVGPLEKELCLLYHHYAAAGLTRSSQCTHWDPGAQHSWERLENLRRKAVRLRGPVSRETRSNKGLPAPVAMAMSCRGVLFAMMGCVKQA